MNYKIRKEQSYHSVIDGIPVFFDGLPEKVEWQTCKEIKIFACYTWTL
ncbi:hypothetical protein AAAU22_01500 [[Clostridium] symbiosum]